jgi:Lon protease-like protein
MLEEALQGPRLFGVGARLELPDEVGGLGIVRACVRNADGTSHLILQGLHRVRFRRWHDRQLYPTALIDLVPSEVLPGDADCLARVMQLCWRLSEIGVVFPESFAQQLRNLDCPSLASDVLAGALVQDNDLRYELLQERKVRRRLSILEKFLLGWLEQGALAEE